MSGNGLLDRLLAQLRLRGLEVRRGRDRGALLLAGPPGEATSDVLAAVKRFKPELLDRLDWRPGPGAESAPPAAETCGRCGAAVTAAFTAADARCLCPVARTRTEPGCPYKE